MPADNSGDAVNVVCNNVSGAQFNIGHTEVVCEAVDSSENKAECQFNVTINGKSVNGRFQRKVYKPGFLGVENKQTSTAFFPFANGLYAFWPYMI